MSDEERAMDDLVREMLWSRHQARRILRWNPPYTFAAHAGAAAIIAHHDQEHPNAPATGPDRILSIAQHARHLAQDVRDHPDRYTAAAAINAQRLGQIDPLLLCHAPRVLAALPGLVTDATNDHERVLLALERDLLAPEDDDGSGAE